MIYLCFDTNVYIKLLLDNYEKESFFAPISDETSSIIFELKALTESNCYTILLPEVIELELEKQNNNITKDIVDNCKLLRETIDDTKEKIWNESHDLLSQLQGTIDTYKDKKLLIWKKYYKQLIAEFNDKSTVKLTLTPEIICETEKLKIKGLITEKQVNDSFLINTLYCFMKQHVADDDKVYLITFDSGFFEKDKLKEKYRRDDLEIHVIYGIEQFEKKLNMKLINKHRNGYNEKAIDAETFDAYDDTDYESDEYLEKIAQDEKKYVREMVDMFEFKVLKQPEDVQTIRKDLIDNICKRLEKCRELDSWDDRSELKLYQRLEGRNEDKVSLSSISELFLIRKNIDEYYDIHCKM